MVRLRQALATENTDAVRTIFLELDAVKAGHAVGRNITRGIAHFINELLFDGLLRDDAPGVLVLGDYELATGFHLDNGIADIVEAFDVVPVGDIPPGCLTAALDDMPGDYAGGHFVPVVHGPAEFVNHGRQRQAGIGDTPRNYNLAAGFQRLEHRLRTQVDIGRGNPGTDVKKILPGLHVGESFPRR